MAKKHYPHPPGTEHTTPRDPKFHKKKNRAKQGNSATIATGSGEAATPSAVSAKVSKKRSAQEEASEAPKLKKAKKNDRKNESARPQKSTTAFASGPTSHSSKRKGKREKAKSAAALASQAFDESQHIAPHLKKFASTHLPPQQVKNWKLTGRTVGTTRLVPRPHKGWNMDDQAGPSTVTATSVDATGTLAHQPEEQKAKQSKDSEATSKSHQGDESYLKVAESTPAAASNEEARRAKSAKKRAKREKRRKEHQQQVEENQSIKSASNGEGMHAESRTSILDPAAPMPEPNEKQEAAYGENTSIARDKLPRCKDPESPTPNVVLRESDGAIVGRKSVAELDLGEFRPKTAFVPGANKQRSFSGSGISSKSNIDPAKRAGLFKPLGGGRITTIPERSLATDSLEAQWKRATKAAGGADSDDSETESESDSSDDDEIEEKPILRGSIRESFAEEMSKQAQPSSVHSASSSRSSSPHYARTNNTSEDESDEEEQEEQLPASPKTSFSELNARLDSDEVLPMDELLKRRRREIYGDDVSSEVTASPSEMEQALPMDELLRKHGLVDDADRGARKHNGVGISNAGDEDEFDVYAAVDAATSEMLGEHIQAMDERKPPQTQRDPTESNEDTIITKASSDHQAETMESAGLVQSTGIQKAVDRSIGVPLDDESESVDGTFSGAEGDDVRDIADLAPEHDEDETSSKQKRKKKTSTSLSGHVKSESQQRELQYAHPIVFIPHDEYEKAVKDVSREPSRKRKMTGASSKHFSTPKRAKRSKSSKNLNAELESIDAPVEVDIAEPDRNVGETASTKPSGSTKRKKKKNDQMNEDSTAQPLAGPGRRRSEVQILNEDAVFATPEKRAKKSSSSKAKDASQEDAPKTPKTASVRKTPKSTGAISSHFIDSRVDIYNTTASSRRVPAGTSVVPAPSINCEKFGIIQEEYWDQPFWLLVAVALLNKTTGRAAVPVFKKILAKYTTPEGLAQAEHDDVFNLIGHLGLQNNRTKTLTMMAKQWVERPPAAGRLYRKRDYPDPGDGKATDVEKIVEEDVPICKGAIEIGHLYGCGAYAFDSWRIFCRDVLRGVADDYKRTNAKSDDFEPEWKRVVPKDKELRACLRWMWLKEGWVWDPLDGSKRKATDEEMERAVKGEMAIDDKEEGKFAARAAGQESSQMELNTPSKKNVDDEILAVLAEDEDGLHGDHPKGDTGDVVIISDDEDNNDPGLADIQAAPSVKAPSVSSSVRRRTPSRFAKVVPSIESPKRTLRSSSSKRKMSGSSRSVHSSSMPADGSILDLTPRRRRAEKARKDVYDDFV